jgi:hypothetical protein
MKKVFLLFSTSLVFLFACGKKDTSPTTPPANTSTGGNSTPSGLSVSNNDDYCGLETTILYKNQNGVITKDSSIYVAFYNAPASSSTRSNVPGGTVTLNGTPISFNTSGNYYSIYPNTSIPISNTLNWNVTGSGTVTAFSQSFTASYPSYSGASYLPDSCSKSNGVTLNINGLSSNQPYAFIYIAGMNVSPVYKLIIGSSSFVTFSAAELASFPVNQPLSISLSLQNNFTAIHGGIKRGFSNRLDYIKQCYLKP